MPAPEYSLIEGDCRILLPALPAGGVQCVVTSPPYWSGAGAAGVIGKEASQHEYAASLLMVFRELRRVLATAGTVWLVLGDHPSSGVSGVPQLVANTLVRDGWSWNGEFVWEEQPRLPLPPRAEAAAPMTGLNGDIPSSGEEDAKQFVFHLTLGHQAFPDYERVWRFRAETAEGYRWSVLPEQLARRCVSDSSKPGELVLDPFCGLASVGVAALKLGRSFTGIEWERWAVQRAWERLRNANRKSP
jgi:DNA modification methylase